MPFKKQRTLEEEVKLLRYGAKLNKYEMKRKEKLRKAKKKK